MSLPASEGSSSFESKLAEFEKDYARERAIERLWYDAVRPVSSLLHHLAMRDYYIQWNWRSMTKEEATIVWPKEVEKPRKK